MRLGYIASYLTFGAWSNLSRSKKWAYFRPAFLPPSLTAVSKTAELKQLRRSRANETRIISGDKENSESILITRCCVGHRGTNPGAQKRVSKIPGTHTPWSKIGKSSRSSVLGRPERRGGRIEYFLRRAGFSTSATSTRGLGLAARERHAQARGPRARTGKNPSCK